MARFPRHGPAQLCVRDSGSPRLDAHLSKCQVDAVLGSTLGNFVITAPLGEGGMGEVFLAEHRRMGRKVAIKVLRPQYSVDPAAVERLFNEARATSIISHPGIVQIFDCDVFEGRAYLVMEFLEGQNLRSHIDGWKVPDTAHVVWLASQIASVLQAAHEKSIVHRDLKPDNVFLTNSHGVHHPVQVKVLDFGIAKLRRTPSEGAHLTGTGMLLGTPLYMSPEQCRGNGNVDERSDIYSLGCMIFEMLAGSPPFQSTASGELIAAHLYEPPPLLVDRAPQTPPWLSALVSKMLHKNPAERPQSMHDVEQALLQGDATAATPAVRVAQTLVLPASQLPKIPRDSAATTTLSAAAHAPTFSERPNSGRLWLSVASVILSLCGIGLWGVLSSGSKTVPHLAAPPPATIEPATQPAPTPVIVTPAQDAPANPDAAVPPFEKPRATSVPRAKQHKNNKPFRGFDEL